MFYLLNMKKNKETKKREKEEKQIAKRDLERDLFLGSLIAINFLISYSYYLQNEK